jgi:hypothetical protein
MAVADNWEYLWKKEKCVCQELTGNRRIRDWIGYSDGQDQRRHEASDWVKAQIKALKAGEDASDDPAITNKRIAYLEAMVEDPYLDVIHWTVPGYPYPDAYDDERAYIKERAFYCSLLNDPENTPPTEDQQHRKRQNFDWINSRRQHITNGVNGEDGATPGWDVSDRRQRYDNLNIANHYGDQYEDWCSGDYKPVDERGSWREKSADWHNAHLGITESPADSNCDSRSDGIRHAQDTCANGTWLRYQPWCGVWTFMGLFQSGKVRSGTDSWMASVASIEDYAKAGNGPFRGWTTDGSKAKKGDLVVLFGRGQHVGTVREITSSTCRTWEGNTSSGSGGSQSNGGGSYKRDRSRSSETYGYALVRD